MPVWTQRDGTAILEDGSGPVLPPIALVALLLQLLHPRRHALLLHIAPLARAPHPARRPVPGKWRETERRVPYRAGLGSLKGRRRRRRRHSIHAVTQSLPEAHCVVQIDVFPGQVDQQLAPVRVERDVGGGEGSKAPTPDLPRLGVGHVAGGKVGNTAWVGRVTWVARAPLGSEDPGIIQSDVGVQGPHGYLLGTYGVDG